VRFEDMSGWREAWLPPCARGARKRNETHDLSWSLALTAENANSTNLHLGGVSIDKRKFFDMLQHQIGHSLLQQLGTPSVYIAAQEQFYNQLKCRYKINKTFSEECCKTNGFAQGDSHSLQVALAMMATWTKYIHRSADQISTGGFVDDSNFFAKGNSIDTVATQVASAWQASQSFDNISGLETNVSKTFNFCQYSVA
jgi:hypothetical protein